MASVAVRELLSETEQRERESPSVAEVAGMSLERFARAGLVVKVRSTLLDEVVLFASDNAELPARRAAAGLPGRRPSPPAPRSHRERLTPA